MEGVDDENLVRAIRKHVDSVHLLDPNTHEELQDCMGTAAYTIAESKP